MAAPEHPGEGQERSGGQLLTLGHGRLEREELAALLTEAGIGQLVDVRRFPGSRTNDAAARGVVEEICTAAGIGYAGPSGWAAGAASPRRRTPTPRIRGGGWPSSAPTPPGPAARSSVRGSRSCSATWPAPAPR